MHEMERSRRGVEVGFLLTLPCVVIMLNIIVWVVAVSRSGFWADDFLNITTYARTLGDLTDVHVNAGQYVINLFWAIGTDAFGTGSVVPFLILNSVVFATGLVMWLWAGIKTSWTAVDAWWICGLFLATAAWLPTALWSSNITHSSGFLALGLGILAHQRAMNARTTFRAMSWSMLCGIAWTSAIISNVLYVGLMVIAVYCAWHQSHNLRRFGVKRVNAAILVGFWNLLLPLVFFVTVVYPARVSKTAYSSPGLRFVHDNLRYYKSILAPTDPLTVVYAALLVGGLIGAVTALRRQRDFFPMAVLGAAGATALPALVQSQQKDIHYMAMPLLLLFSALVAGGRPMLLGWSKRLGSAVLVAAAAVLMLVFLQGANVRAYFVQSPYGSSLATFRSQVASLTPEGGIICARLDVNASQEAIFIAEMSGVDGFRIPPISATQVYIVDGAKPCPTGTSATSIIINMNARGEFVASR